MFGDPVVSGVRARSHRHMVKFRIAAGAKAAVADDMNHKTVAARDARDLVFDRAGIAIEKNLQQSLPLRFNATGARIETKFAAPRA